MGGGRGVGLGSCIHFLHVSRENGGGGGLESSPPTRTTTDHRYCLYYLARSLDTFGDDEENGNPDEEVTESELPYKTTWFLDAGRFP